jgi:hypothetical protein
MDIGIILSLIGIASLIVERAFSTFREAKKSECLVGGHRVFEVKQEHFEK